MKVFRELTFQGAPNDLARFLEEVDSDLSNGWRRDSELERRDARLTTSRLERIYFCPRARCGVAIRLCIMERSDGSLYVSSIIPVEVNQLTYEEYNSILEEFHDRYAIVAAAKNSVIVGLSPDRLLLEEIVPETVLDRLVDFASAANPYTGSDQPGDRQRWQNFVIESHETGCGLPGDTLKRWLVEERRWPEDVATELVNQYDFGRSLLAHEHAATA